jgi:hypothetical protein
VLTEPAKMSGLDLLVEKAPEDLSIPQRSIRQARDGTLVWWGGADTPGPVQAVSPGTAAPILVGVSPMRPGYNVAVEYRVNGGPVRETIGLVDPRVRDACARIFRAVVPGQPEGLVEFMPVLRFAGQPISPRLLESAECPRYQVGCGTAPAEAKDMQAPMARPPGEPRGDWDARFLGACTIQLRKEVVGATPDGLRINWHFVEAPFVGPVLEGAFLPGAADFMRIRADGVAIVQVRGCIETRKGARIYTSYGGNLDLGRDGYDRALRGEFDPWPPFVCAPTYATADKELEWLNRAQCLIVGRVNMKALTVESDAYFIDVGGRKRSNERVSSRGGGIL